MMPRDGSGDNDAPHKDGRKRFILRLWDRNPNGPLLLPGQAPRGYRTPNGQVWGHTLSDFFSIELIFGALGRSIWSTIMFQKLNEILPPSKKELIDTYPHHFPRVLQPWPLLCVPNDNG